MAIAFDSASGGSLHGQPVQWNHTCTGTNLLLVLAFQVNANITNTNITATYNGVNMTQFSTQQNAGLTSCFFYLLNPATGTNQISVAQIQATRDNVAAAASYTGVLQTDPTFIDANAQNNTGGSSTNNITQALTTIAANDWLIGGFTAVNGSNATTYTGNGTTTIRFNQHLTQTLASVGDLPATTAGSYTLDATTDNNGLLSLSAIAVKPVPPVGPGNVKTFDGVTQSTDVKTYLGVAVASVKSFNGVT